MDRVIVSEAIPRIKWKIYLIGLFTGNLPKSLDFWIIIALW